MDELWAGTLIEDEDGYHFNFEIEYLKSEFPVPLSLTLPITNETFLNKSSWN